MHLRPGLRALPQPSRDRLVLVILRIHAVKPEDPAQDQPAKPFRRKQFCMPPGGHVDAQVVEPAPALVGSDAEAFPNSLRRVAPMMQRQRTDDQVERPVREGKALHVAADELDGRPGGAGVCAWAWFRET